MKKRALVTGAKRGIGLLIKEVLNAGGVEVVAPSRQELNLSDRKSVEAYLRHGPQDIDILINNAAENIIKDIPSIDLATWDLILQTNLTSPLQLIQHYAPLMAAKKFGRIVNISSVYSAKARAGRCMYSSSKSALDALTRTSAVEFSYANVLINSVCPGFVDTDLTRKNNTETQIQQLVSRIPIGRMADSKEIAKFVSYLASSENTYITGQSITIDGAFSIS